MKMQTRQHRIAPRVQVIELRGTYTSKPLSSGELKAALSALKLVGIDPARMMDDSARFALDQLLELGI